MGQVSYSRAARLVIARLLVGQVCYCRAAGEGRFVIVGLLLGQVCYCRVARCVIIGLLHGAAFLL